MSAEAKPKRPGKVAAPKALDADACEAAGMPREDAPVKMARSARKRSGKALAVADPPAFVDVGCETPPLFDLAEPPASSSGSYSNELPIEAPPVDESFPWDPLGEAPAPDPCDTCHGGGTVDEPGTPEAGGAGVFDCPDCEEPAILGQESGEAWVLYHGDTVEVARALRAESVGLSVFSPPFSSLFTYSDSPRDMGNVANDAEFFAGFAYLVREQARVMKPGGIVAIHCMDIPTSKARDGFIGLRDFPGDIIRAYQSEGFVFHSRITIWKDPVIAQQRTKALGLLHKQLVKDSSMSRQGIPDYIIVMRKPGDRDPPVSHQNVDGDVFGNQGGEKLTRASIDLWQQYASPVWATPIGETPDGFVMLGGDINPNDTLNARGAREEKDEAHLCPLQLEVIRRCVHLWSAPGDVVWSPFAGIASEGFVAVQMGRRFVGAELKRSYWEQGVANLRAASTPSAQIDLFGGAP